MNSLIPLRTSGSFCNFFASAQKSSPLAFGFIDGICRAKYLKLLPYAVDGDRRPQASHSFELLSGLLAEDSKKRIEVLATETIETEIKNAKNPALSSLFYSLIKGVIKRSKRSAELAEEYITSCKNEKLRLVTAGDCEIVACSVLAGARLFVTENRKTLNNPKVIGILNRVNDAKNLKPVKMADANNAKGELDV